MGRDFWQPLRKRHFPRREHLLEIINNLLDISKIEAGETEIRDEVIDLAELLGESLTAMRIQAQRKKLALVLDMPPGIPRLRGDALRLRQVLINPSQMRSNSLNQRRSLRCMGYWRDAPSRTCSFFHARSDRVSGPPAQDDRYATTIRTYDRMAQAWRVEFINPAAPETSARLMARRRGQNIEMEGKLSCGASIRWHYRSITAKSFHYSAERLGDDGKSWQLYLELFGTRAQS
jgi:hypothetical protein